MAENEEIEGEEKKSSKVIIIAAVVLLLLIGGGAGYYFMAGDDSSESVENSEEQKKGDEAAVASEQVYYDMEQALIVNFPKGSAASLIQVSLSLLLDSVETIDAVKKHEPMIRNNLLMAISAKGADKLQTTEGKNELRTEMLAEITNVMERMSKKNKVNNIFFTAFVMQ